MSFLTPWFLIGLLAAAIPAVLHLRRSQRKNKIVFSHTAFFDDQFLRTARRARFQDLLLMLLRMCLFVLLALALAQPVLRLPWLASLPGPWGGKQTVAIVLDDSASMSAADAQGTLLDRAKAAALDVVAGLAAERGDVVTVLLAGARDAGPRVLFDPPTSDLAQVREAIRGVRPTDLGTDLPGAIASAERLIAAASNRDVYVFSDFSTTAVPASGGLMAEPQTALILVAAQPAASPAANIAIDAVQFGASRPMLGVPFTFRVQWSSIGGQPCKLGLNLVVDDQVVAHREVDAEPGRSQVTRFIHRFTKPGWHRGRVEWETPAGQPPVADALTADNRRYFALAVEDRLKILAVDGAPSESPAADELLFFRVAMNLQGGTGAAAAAPVASAGPPSATAPASSERVVALDTITAGQLAAASLDAYNLVLLANVADLCACGTDKIGALRRRRWQPAGDARRSGRSRALQPVDR